MKVLRPGTDTSVLGKDVRIRTRVLGRQSDMIWVCWLLHPGTDTSVLGKGVSVQTIPIIDRLDTGDVLRGVSGFL
jgi:hypothetical protein